VVRCFLGASIALTVPSFFSGPRPLFQEFDV
jgi:hypothetical protein